MKQNFKPFAMFFEEIGAADELPPVSVEYDPIEGLSFVHVGKRRKPFVEWSLDYFGTKTGDHTKQIVDPTDTDLFDC